ncbi:hypothetical protein DRO49_05510 [Candidatus Bathyarchaeota archaeon]|nr:MAG: hypothetical protein DRO49_05510 [Candidatus Bathyarchaeota archaeon]
MKEKMPLEWTEEEKDEFILWTAERYNWADGALREARRERFKALRPLMNISRIAKEAKLMVRSGDFSKLPKLRKELAKVGVEKTVEELKDVWAIEDAVEEARDRILNSEEYKEKKDTEKRARAVVTRYDIKITERLKEKGLYMPKPLRELENLDPEVEAEVQEILKRWEERREQFKKGEEKEEQKEQKERKEEK